MCHFQGSSRSSHLSRGSRRVVCSNTAVKNSRARTRSKRQYSYVFKTFELCQTRLEGTMNHAHTFILCGFLLSISYWNKNNHKQVFNIRPWFATNAKQRYLYNSQTRRATTFQSCPPGDGKESLHFLFFFGSAVERSIPDKQCVSSNTPPCLCCFFSFSFLLTPSMLVQIPLSLLFCYHFFLLLYCCTHIVGS